MKVLIAGSIVLVVSVAGAYAAEAPAGNCQSLVTQGSCVYASPLQGGETDRIGTLSGIEGRVMASGANGFTPAKSETSLRIGDRVLVLEGGKATVQAGSFSQALAVPSMIDASAMGECGCLTVQSDVRTFAQAPAGAAGVGAAAGGGGGGAAGAGAAAGAASAAGAGAGAAGAGALGGIAAATGLSVTAVAVGGVAVAGAVAIGATVAVSESTKKEETPASP